MTSKNSIFSSITFAFLLSVLLSGCLGDDKTAETIISNWQNATVKSFSLSDNSDVCKNLSSYSFTIDHFGTSDPVLAAKMPGAGIIFNPDSLPVGTEPDSIKIVMDLNNASSAIFSQYDRQGFLAKTTNFKDTQLVYFNDYSVTRLDLVSYDETVKKSYFIKVNIHKVYGDTIRWKYNAKDLWETAGVVEQRVVACGAESRPLWFLRYADGTVKLKKSAGSLGKLEWTGEDCAVRFDTDERPVLSTLFSLEETDGGVWCIGDGGNLMTSQTGEDFTTVKSPLQFVSILGFQPATKKQGKHLHAVVRDGEKLRFARTFDLANPAAWEVLDEVPAGFPIKNFSNPISTEANPSAGNMTSRLYIVGGETAEGTITSSTWSCDGNSWAEFKQSFLPAMKNGAIIPYSLDADNPGSLWLLWPGILADGSVRNTLYFSENKGVTWKLLSSEYPAYAATSSLTAVGAVSPLLDEKDFRMYFFGGIDSEGRQRADVFGGQLVKLTFKKTK